MEFKVLSSFKYTSCLCERNIHLLSKPFDEVLSLSQTKITEMNVKKLMKRAPSIVKFRKYVLC